MTKLNYSSIAALIADFKAGAKFEITGIDAATPGPVLSMKEDKRGVRVFVATSEFGTVFALDGSHATSSNVYLSKVAAAPFLKRFVLGESAYCPATREVVESVEFTNGAILVTLTNEDGVSRTSTNYDHEGKHHWVPGRSLVLGELPAPPAPQTYSSEDLWTTAPAGDYKADQGGYGFRVRVVTNGQARAVLFSPLGLGINALDLMSREAWTDTRFVAAE